MLLIFAEVRTLDDNTRVYECHRPSLYKHTECLHGRIITREHELAIDRCMVFTLDRRWIPNGTASADRRFASSVEHALHRESCVEHALRRECLFATSESQLSFCT